MNICLAPHRADFPRALSRSRPKLTAALLLVISAVTPASPAPVKVDLTEVPLEELMYNFQVQSVYGASKHEQKLSEAPSSVTIIDAEEFNLYGYRTFAEALNSVRSLYISDDRNYSHLGVRGFNRPGDYSSRILVLVNGHRVNENVFDSILIGYEFPLDVGLIQRIEVIRGPSSSIYGNNAFFGVINVVTKDAAAVDGVTLSTSYGSFDAVKARLTYGKKFSEDMSLLVSASYYDCGGPHALYYPEYNTDTNRVNGGVTNDTDYERAFKAFASLTLHELTLEATFSTREKGIPTGSYGTIFNDRSARTTDSFGWIDLRYAHEFADGWQIFGRAAYDRYRYDGNYPLLDSTAARFIYSDYALGTALSGECKLTKKLFDRHTLTFGAEARDNLKQDQGNHDTAVPPSPPVSDESKSKTIGVYGQAEVAVSPSLMVNGGIRWDHFGTFGGTVNPRLALIYGLSDTTTIKALYGRAFKAPNAYELYYTGPNNEGNPRLTPETISTYELVLEKALNKNLTFLATGYAYQINGLINQITDPANDLLVYANTSRATARGGELELNGKIYGRIHGRLSYSIQRTYESQTHQELTNSPRHLAKANVSFPIWKEKDFLGLEALYSSAAGTPGGASAPAYCLLNLTLFARNIMYHTDASLSIYNLLNTTYSYPASGELLQDTVQQNGRTFRATLTFSF